MTRIHFEGWEAFVSPLGGVGGNQFMVSIDCHDYPIRLISWEEDFLTFEIEGRTVSAVTEAQDGRVEVMLEGCHASFLLEEGNEVRQRGGHPSGESEYGAVRAELPGRILEVLVSEGELVQAGQVLLISEAMKMEHPVRAAVLARVGRVHVGEGAQIADGDVLLELHPPEERPSGTSA